MTPATSLRPTTAADLAYVTALERRPEHLDFIGQWNDGEHRAAIAGEASRSHWIIERDGAPAGYLIAYDLRAEVGGIYVKRILVGDKGRGTGTEALRLFLKQVFAEPSTEFVWLLVREGNARAQAVYRNLGFVRFDLEPAEARRFDPLADTPNGSFRMVLRRA